MKDNTISEQNKSKIVQALKQISAEHGEEIFFDADRFGNKLSDVLADANLLNVCEWLTSIIRMGAYNQLKCAFENREFIREATKIACLLHEEKNADINFSKEITGIISALFTDKLVFTDIDDTENTEGVALHKINTTSKVQGESMVQPTIYTETVIIPHSQRWENEKREQEQQRQAASKQYLRKDISNMHQATHNRVQSSNNAVLETLLHLAKEQCGYSRGSEAMRELVKLFPSEQSTQKLLEYVEKAKRGYSAGEEALGFLLKLFPSSIQKILIDRVKGHSGYSTGDNAMKLLVRLYPNEQSALDILKYVEEKHRGYSTGDEALEFLFKLFPSSIQKILIDRVKGYSGYSTGDNAMKFLVRLYPNEQSTLDILGQVIKKHSGYSTGDLAVKYLIKLSGQGGQV